VSLPVATNQRPHATTLTIVASLDENARHGTVPSTIVSEKIRHHVTCRPNIFRGRCLRWANQWRQHCAHGTISKVGIYRTLQF